MIYYVIPAREGSKGLPHKNRTLIEYTIKEIPENYRDSVIITTDDEYIIDKYSDYNVVVRPDIFSNDTASMRDVLNHVSVDMKKHDIIVLLYLTYQDKCLKKLLK